MDHRVSIALKPDSRPLDISRLPGIDPCLSLLCRFFPPIKYLSSVIVIAEKCDPKKNPAPAGFQYSISFL